MNLINMQIFFIELQCMMPRNIMKDRWKNDPITKFSNLMTRDTKGNFLHSGITMRKSGCIDFYSNFRLVEETQASVEATVTGLNEDRFKATRKDAGKFQDVASDFGSLYFKDQVDIYRCSMSWKNEIGLSVSKPI